MNQHRELVVKMFRELFVGMKYFSGTLHGLFVTVYFLVPEHDGDVFLRFFRC